MGARARRGEGARKKGEKKTRERERKKGGEGARELCKEYTVFDILKFSLGIRPRGACVFLVCVSWPRY